MVNHYYARVGSLVGITRPQALRAKRVRQSLQGELLPLLLRRRSLIRTVDTLCAFVFFTFGINKNQTTCTFSRVRHNNRAHDGVSMCVRPPPPYTGNVSWLLVSRYPEYLPGNRTHFDGPYGAGPG